MKKKYTLALALLLPVSLLFAAACDKASPVAPSGTVLTISVSPSQITANGTATVLVSALKPNGTPVNPGTQIRFSTSLGTIDPVAEIGTDGVATATLRGTGEIGTATVTARAGANEAVTAEVAIGKTAGSVTLQANPAQVPEDGGTVQLLAVVRDDTGQPLAGEAVNFQTEVGRLQSGGTVLRTDANGQVRDTLHVTEEDLAALTAIQFQVTAVAGANKTATATIRKSQCRPEVAFEVAAGDEGSNLVRIVSNTTSGRRPIQFLWDKEDDGTIDSELESPGTFTYETNGTKRVRLTAINECGQDSDVRPVTLP